MLEDDWTSFVRDNCPHPCKIAGHVDYTRFGGYRRHAKESKTHSSKYIHAVIINFYLDPYTTLSMHRQPRTR